MNELNYVITRVADLIIGLFSSIKAFFLIPNTNQLNFFGIIFLPILVISIIDICLKIITGGDTNEED